MTALGAERTLARGDHLFRQGQPVHAVFQLRRGCIRLQRVTVEGAAVTLHTAMPGEWFAEAALFSTHYHCDAVAVADSAVCAVPRLALHDGLQAHPQALWRFAADLARRVQGLRTRLAVQQTRGARERIVQYLHLQADAHGFFQPAGTLKAWAAELGLTHEALYRELAALARDGVIRREGRALTWRERSGSAAKATPVVTKKRKR